MYQNKTLSSLVLVFLGFDINSDWMIWCFICSLLQPFQLHQNTWTRLT